MKRKLALGAVLSTSALLAGAIQVSAGLAQAAPQPDLAQQHASLISQSRQAAPGAARALGLGSQEALVVKDAVVDANGTRHTRYERTLNGLPVIGGDLVVHQTAKGAVTSVDRAVQGPIAPASLTPKLSAAQAAAKATGAVRATIGVKDTEGAVLTSANSTGDAALVVWATSGAPRLAYRSTVTGVRADGTPSSQVVVTDAASGAVLSTHEQIQTVDATGTGNGVFVGSVALTTTLSGSTYQLKDATRGGQYSTDLAHKTQGTGTLYTDADNAWGTGTVSSGQSAAVDAQYGAAATWDFYKNTFGRNGIRGDGVGAYSRVHYGRNYVNAFWSDSCFCMTYGDGASNTHPLTEIDVAGHEMS
ncbi:M4 family metallopeptidase, partial [Kitasatospora paranensis]